jgi:hypothetical protein
LLNHGFLSASKGLIKSSIFGALGTPSGMLLVGFGGGDGGFGSASVRLTSGGSLIRWWRFSLVGLSGVMAIGSRRLLSPVDTSASKGGSSDVTPPLPVSSDLTLSEPSPYSIL